MHLSGKYSQYALPSSWLGSPPTLSVDESLYPAEKKAFDFSWFWLLGKKIPGTPHVKVFPMASVPPKAPPGDDGLSLYHWWWVSLIRHLFQTSDPRLPPWLSHWLLKKSGKFVVFLPDPGVSGPLGSVTTYIQELFEILLIMWLWLMMIPIQY